MMPTMTRTFTPARLFAAVAAASALMVAGHSYADGLILEEIVVTAQKRAENLQDVASSIAAVSSDALDSNGITNFTDAAKLVPGLSMRKSTPTNTQISLRGVTYDRQSAASEAVDVYWNGAVYQANSMFAAMFDVERLEVLRGPQGTLQGKTSPAGAIILHTQKPDFEVVEGQVKSSFDDNGDAFAEFGLSLPLGETLAVRVAGMSNNTDGNGVEHVSGQESDTDTQAGRITLAWEPSEDFDATLMAEYMTSEALEYTQVVASPTPIAELFEMQGLNADDRKSQQAAPSVMDMQTDITVLTANWRGLDNHEISFVGSYVTNEVSLTNDVDKTGILTLGMGFQLAGNPALGIDVPFEVATESTVRSSSQELRIASLSDSWWEYTNGVYYSNFETNVQAFNDLAPAEIVGVNNAAYGVTDSLLATEEFGVFSHNRIDLSDVSELQIGLRYSKIRREELTAYSQGVGATLLPAQTLTDNQHSVDESFTGGLKYIRYLTEDVMAYASVDASYRPTGQSYHPTINGSNGSVTPGAEIMEDMRFAEEDTLAFEVGFKSTLLDGRAQLNGAFYYQSMNEYQSQFKDIKADGNGNGVVATDPNDAAPKFLTSNVDATSIGAELELKALLTENWTLGTTLSYNDFTFDDGQQAPCNDSAHDFTTDGWVATCDVSGQRVGDAPNWSLNVSSEYTIPMDQFDVFVRGLYKYDGARTNPTLVESDAGLAHRSGYGVVDLFTGLRSKDQLWEVSAWSKNLFDKQAESRSVAGRNTAVFGDYREAYFIDERSVGVNLRYNFSM